MSKSTLSSIQSRLVSRVAATVILTSFAGAAVTFPVRVAIAQGTPKPATPITKEQAKKAWGEGMTLEGQGDWAEAQKRFEMVSQFRMTPAVRFHIAFCKEKRGLLLEALKDFETAAADAKNENVAQVIKEAPEHVEAIKPKIPKIKFKVPSDVENVALTVDGEVVDAKGVDEMQVNPGKHKVEAKADQRKDFTQEFDLGEGETKTITVKLPPIKDEKIEEPPPPPPPEQKMETHRKISTLAIGVTAAGGVSLILSGVFFLQRNSAKNDLDSACDTNTLQCPADKSDTINKGKTATTLTNVFGAIGIVGVGVGVYLILTSPTEQVPVESTTKAGAVRVVPSAPGANLGGLALTGAF